MPQIIEIPDIGSVEFPDGMTRAEMEAAIRSNFFSDQTTTEVAEGEDAGDFSKAISSGLDRMGTAFSVVGSELGLVDQEDLAASLVSQEQPMYSPETEAGLQEIMESQGFFETLGNLVTNPMATGILAAENIPQLAATIPSTVIGGLAGSLAGPVGTVAGLSTGAALPSFALEYGNVLNEELQKTGAVTQEGMLASLNDPEFMARARERAVKRGVPIAAFDALSMGLAGKPFQLARKVGGGRIAGVGAEVGTQAVTAGAGEAGAQLFSEGEITNLRDIALEGALEALIGTPTEVMAGYAARRGRQPTADDATTPTTDDGSATPAAEAEPLITDPRSRIALTTAEVEGGVTPTSELDRFVEQLSERPKLQAAAQQLQTLDLSPVETRQTMAALQDAFEINDNAAFDPTITLSTEGLQVDGADAKGGFSVDRGEIIIDPKANPRAAMAHEVLHFHDSIFQQQNPKAHAAWSSSFKGASTLRTALSPAVKRLLDPELLAQYNTTLQEKGVQITPREARAYAIELYKLTGRPAKRSLLSRAFDFFGDSIDRIAAKMAGRQTQKEALLFAAEGQITKALPTPVEVPQRQEAPKETPITTPPAVYTTQTFTPKNDEGEVTGQPITSLSDGPNTVYLSRIDGDWFQTDESGSPIIAEGMAQPAPLSSINKTEAIDRAKEVLAAMEKPSAEAYRRSLTQETAIPEAPVENVQPTDEAVTPAGTKVGVTYEVKEMGDLIPSQTDDLQANPDYVAALQPRDRKRAASEQQINKISRELNPAFLLKSASSADGAPIIGTDNMVESGNGRVLALRKAIQGNPEAYANYTKAIADAGFDTTGFNNPVLVRVNRTAISPDARAEFVRESNMRTTLGMSSTEMAAADADAMTPEIVAQYQGGDINSAANNGFRRAFMGDVVSEADSAQYMDEKGQINIDGIRRIDAALFRYAYDDDRLVADYFETADQTRKSVGNALRELAPQYAMMRNAAERGEIDPFMDTTDSLRDALNVYRRAKDEGRSVAEFVDQVDVFSGEVDPVQKGWLRTFFADNTFNKPASSKGVADRLRYYIDEANKTSAGPDLIGDKPTPQQLLEGAVRQKDATPEAAVQQDLLPTPANDLAATEHRPAISVANEASLNITDPGGDVTTDPKEVGFGELEFSLNIDALTKNKRGAPFFGRVINTKEAETLSQKVQGQFGAGRVIYPIGQEGTGAKDTGGFGRQHVRKRGHTEELQQLGFKDDVEAMEYVTSNHDGMRPTTDIRGNAIKGLLEATKRIGSKDYKIQALVVPVIDPQTRDTYYQAVTIYSPDVKLNRTKNIDPEIRNLEFSMNIDPEVNAAADKVHARAGSNTTSLLDTFANKLTEFKNGAWITAIFDRYYPVNKLERERFGGVLPVAEKSAYKMMRLSNDVSGTISYFLNNGQAKFTEAGFVPTEGKKSLLNIIEPIIKTYGDDGLHLFGAYTYAVRSNRLLQEGRESVLSQGEVSTLLDLGRQYPLFEQARKEYVEFNDSIMQIAVETGVLSREMARVWSSYGDYVPFYRVLDPDSRIVTPPAVGGIGRVGAASRRLKGGEAKVNNVLDNMVKNTEYLIAKSLKNRSMQLMVDNFGPGTGVDVFTTVPSARATPVQVSPDSIRQTLRKALGEDNPLLEDIKGIDGLQTIFAMEPILRNNKDNIVYVRRERNVLNEQSGEYEKIHGTEYFEVKDDDVYAALTELPPKSMGKLMDIMNGGRTFFSRMITMMPDFMLANLMRDTMATRALRGGYNPLTGVFRGLSASLRDSNVQQELRLNGGMAIGGYYGNDLRRFKKMTGSKSNPLIAAPGNAWALWDKVGQATEQANRLSVYRGQREAGAGGFEAAFQSRDIIDYSLSGRHKAVQLLIRIIPFLNARAQGGYSLARGLNKNNRKNFLLMSSIYAGAATILYGMNYDDERYQEESQVSKDLYLHIYLDKIIPREALEAVGISNPHIAIPKPFELGAISMTIPERIMQQMIDEDAEGEDFVKTMGFVLSSIFKISPSELAGPYIKTVIQDRMLYDFFRQRDLVPSHQRQFIDQEGEAEATITDRTSDIVAAASRALDIAPQRVQNFVDGFFPKIGSIVLQAGDMVQRAKDGKPPLPKEFEDTILGRFTVGRFNPAEFPGYSASEAELRELNGQLKTYMQAIRNSEEHGTDAQLDNVIEMVGDKEVFAKTVRDTVDELNVMSADERYIRDFSDDSIEVKKKELEEMKRERARLAREVLKEYKDFIK